MTLMRAHKTAMLVIALAVAAFGAALAFARPGYHPAVMPSPGFKSDDPKINPAEIFQKWEETRYHEPQDDIDQPGLDFDAAAQFARFALLCGYLISEEPQRPTWNKGDFFGDHYAKSRK